jgi:hypothetical protein
MFGYIRRILGWIELDLDRNFVHPLNCGRNDYRAPKKLELDVAAHHHRLGSPTTFRRVG